MPKKTGKDEGSGGKEEDEAAASSSSSAVATTTGATAAPVFPDPALLARIKAQLAAMGIRDANERQTREAKERYAFWETQPVVQFKGAGGSGNGSDNGNGSGAPAGDAPPPEQQQQLEEDGPIDAPKTVADVKKEPYALAPG